MGHLTTYQLEQRTKLISLETYEQLSQKSNFVQIQETPKNIISTFGIRYDEELGGIFIWSGSMQRYYLIAKMNNCNE